MTRSVEIPEAAVAAAAEGLRSHSAYEEPQVLARSALEAALPYLAPAGADNAYHYSTEEIAAKVADRVPHADMDGFTLSDRLRIGKAVAPLFQEMLPPAAPAGDGGLREALAMKVGAWKYERGDLYWASQELGDLLAAYPAEPVNFRRAAEEANLRMGQSRDWALPQTAERGLREALGQAWDDGNATGLDGYVGPGRGAGEVDPEAERARERILDKLADHPAAPAVPQPADEARMREYLDSCVWIDPGRQSGQPCFGGTRVPVAPFMAIVDEAGEDAAKAFWPSVTDAHIKAGRAWQAAVPQPVDREALDRVLANIPVSYSHTLLTHNATAGRLAPHARKLIVDAVLAVLAGEQDQVEP